MQDSDLTADLTSRITGSALTDRDPGQGGGARDIEHVVQEQSRTGRTWTSSARLSLTQPLGEQHSLELFGQQSATRENRDNSVFDLVEGAAIHNAELSSGFERAYTYLRGGARFSRIGATSWMSVGLQMQRSNLDGTIVDRDETIASGYTHLLANALFRSVLKQGHNLNVTYSGRSREPSLTQLQPYADNSDPLNVYSGNPDLQPEYLHRLNADYQFFDQFTFVNFCRQRRSKLHRQRDLAVARL